MEKMDKTEKNELSAAKKVVGFNQTKKAVESKSAKKIFAASDADERFLLQVKRLCEAEPLEVGCAVCAVLK